MVDQPAVGPLRLRICSDSLPAPLPTIARSLPAPLVLPLFAMKIPEMIVPYADAAEVMVAHLQRGDAMSRHRVGIALPVSKKGKKDQWAAAPRGRGSRRHGGQPDAWERYPCMTAHAGVNLGNFDPELIASVRVRRFDGADTWQFLDE